MTAGIETSEVACIDVGRLVKIVTEEMERQLQSDPEAYEPKLVAIGPYHRDKAKADSKTKADFRTMEKLKWQLLEHYLSRAPKGSMDQYLREMKGFEKRARSCYSEEIGMKSDEFVEMLLLDGCFLVQMISAFVTPGERPEELMFLLKYNTWFPNLLFRDLLLLENQLPYFVVKYLLDQLGIEEWDASKTALTLFSSFLPRELDIPPSEALLQDSEVRHFLHLLHKWILLDLATKRRRKEPSPVRLCSALSSLTNRTKDQPFKLIPRCSGASDPQQEEEPLATPLINEASDGSSGVIPSSIPSVIGLREAGVEVKKREVKKSCAAAKVTPLRFNTRKLLPSIPSVTGLAYAGVVMKAMEEEDNFLNISFRKDKGILTTPTIKIDDDTSFILRNLIAFEQCYPKPYPISDPTSMHVTNYTLFMDHIINTPRDVKFLCEKEIIHRNLDSDKKIAMLFNKLGKGVVYKQEGNHLDEVYKDVQSYCDQKWHKWRATLMHNYFSNPWTMISVVATVVLLVLTILQSVYSVLSYYQG